MHAYLAWDTQSETLKVIVKADLTGEFSDQLNGQTILALSALDAMRPPGAAIAAVSCARAVVGSTLASRMA